MTFDKQELSGDVVWTWQTAGDLPAVENVSVSKQFTLLIKADLHSPQSLCTASAENRQPVCSIKSEINGDMPFIACEFWTDYGDAPLRLACPQIPGLQGVILRYTGTNLQLFFGGVLVDEEWPTGKLCGGGIVSILGETDGVLWNRALFDEEIETLSGGAAAVADSVNALFGEDTGQRQYWRPRGFGTGAGDCMPFFHAGRFHLFYLFDRHSHTSKWGKGAHQWAHCSTVDLIHWEQHPLAVAITEEHEGSICTGSVFYWQGIFSAFYAVREMDGSAAPIMAATSTDGIHFDKQPHQTFLTDAYLQPDVRDPVVFRDEATGLFQMLVTTGRRPDPSGQSGGCLVHLTSEDLTVWQERSTFLHAGTGIEADWNAQPECPDYFRWGKWYYLLFGVDGHTHYRVSKAPYGPWIRLKVDVLDGAALKVMKTAEFTGGRRLAAGFINAGHYGGDVVLREVIQSADGSLGTKYVPELIPECRPRLTLMPQTLTGSEQAAAATTALPINSRVRMRVHSEPGTQTFGLVLGDSLHESVSCALCFEPTQGQVMWLSTEQPKASERMGAALHSVTGLDQPFTLDLILKGDLADICINDTRTLIVRLPQPRPEPLRWFVQDGEVTFSEIEVWPLL